MSRRAAIFWPAAPQHQDESPGAHWRLLDTTGDRQRPLEMNRDQWGPSETAGGRQRPPDTAGHHQMPPDTTLGLPWSATQVTGACRWHFATLRISKPLGGAQCAEYSNRSSKKVDAPSLETFKMERQLFREAQASSSGGKNFWQDWAINN